MGAATAHADAHNWSLWQAAVDVHVIWRAQFGAFEVHLIPSPLPGKASQVSRGVPSTTPLPVPVQMGAASCGNTTESNTRSKMNCRHRGEDENAALRCPPAHWCLRVGTCQLSPAEGAGATPCCQHCCCWWGTAWWKTCLRDPRPSCCWESCPAGRHQSLSQGLGRGSCHAGASSSMSCHGGRAMAL